MRALIWNPASSFVLVGVLSGGGFTSGATGARSASALRPSIRIAHPHRLFPCHIYMHTVGNVLHVLFPEHNGQSEPMCLTLFKEDEGQESEPAIRFAHILGNRNVPFSRSGRPRRDQPRRTMFARSKAPSGCCCSRPPQAIAHPTTRPSPLPPMRGHPVPHTTPTLPDLITRRSGRWDQQAIP